MEPVFGSIGKFGHKETPETSAVSGVLKSLMRDRLSLGVIALALVLLVPFSAWAMVEAATSVFLQVVPGSSALLSDTA